MTLTNIAGKLSTAVGTPTQGSITISNPAFTAGDGTPVASNLITVPIASDGSYSVHLAPTDQTTPFVYYSATYHLVHGNAIATETWSVPTTTATLTIPQIRIQKSIPPPPFAVQTSQLYYATAAIGDALIWNGQQWTPTTILQSYGFTYSNQTTLFIPGVTHGQGSRLVVAVYDTNGNATQPAINVNPGSGDTTISFGAPSSGYGFISGGLGKSLPNFSMGFVGCSQAIIPQSLHHFATNQLAVVVYDRLGTVIGFPSVAVSVDSQIKVTVTVASPMTFSVVIMGAVGATVNIAPSGGALTTPTPYITSISGSTIATISAADHGKGPGALAFGFTDNTPSLAAALDYTRDSSGNLGIAFGDYFTGTVEIVSGSFSGLSTPFSTTVSVPASALTIAAGAHHQGAYALAFAFSADDPAIAVDIEYTRDTVGNLILSFAPLFTGTVQVVPGGWQGTSLYATTVTAQTTVTILAAAHGKGASVLVAAFDEHGIAANMDWARDASGNVILNFSTPFTGVLQVYAPQ